MRHVLTAETYERKASLGGGFRGVVYSRTTKVRDQSDVLATEEEARLWARSRVSEIMGTVAWAPGYVYRPNWHMNVWTA